MGWIKKYNLTINILFWLLAVCICSVIILWKVNPDLLKPGVDSIFHAMYENRVIVETRPVVVKEVEEVEWFYFIATGYSANDPNQGTDNTTATGSKTREGIVAVDPKIIPLGTRIEIKGMGTFVAGDTGGKIKGNRIDIFFSSKEEAKRFGKKGVWIRVLEKDIELAETYS
ncbi:MAG: 3D domain-containing protein [Actinobacteria bacterium]|nr:3D domain-containing protein [Actinomycetota bacterium]